MRYGGHTGKIEACACQFKHLFLGIPKWLIQNKLANVPVRPLPATSTSLRSVRSSVPPSRMSVRQFLPVTRRSLLKPSRRLSVWLMQCAPRVPCTRTPLRVTRAACPPPSRRWPNSVLLSFSVFVPQRGRFSRLSETHRLLLGAFLLRKSSFSSTTNRSGVLCRESDAWHMWLNLRL